jgi:hypothetical protein
MTVQITIILKRKCTTIKKIVINSLRRFSVCTDFTYSWAVLSNDTFRLWFPKGDRNTNSLASLDLTAHIQWSVSTPARRVLLRLRPSGRSEFHKTYTNRSVPKECSRNNSGLASCTRTEGVHSTDLTAEYSSKNTNMSDFWREDSGKSFVLGARIFRRVRIQNSTIAFGVSANLFIVLKNGIHLNHLHKLRAYLT